MLGSLLAGTDEAPGDITTTPEGLKKRYRGMASKDAQMEWRGRYSSDEGVSTFIRYKGSVVDILEDLRWRHVVWLVPIQGVELLKDCKQQPNGQDKQRPVYPKVKPTFFLNEKKKSKTRRSENHHHR